MRQAAIMSQEHPRWDEFVWRLEGPEGCNFREVKGEVRWDCEGGRNKELAIAILKDMGGIDIAESLSYFEDRGGYCDCEIIFNVGRENDEN